METLSFPKMFKNGKTQIQQDHKAILQSLKLLLSSEKGSLLGDPRYGAELNRVLFSQNNQIIKDIVIDEIYTSILLFMPQVRVNRNDIDIVLDGSKVYAKIRCVYYLDQVADLYTISLTDAEADDIK